MTEPTIERMQARAQELRRRFPRLRHLPHPLVALSAALLILSFHPFSLSFCAWLALIPWFEFLYRSETRRAAFVQSVWLGWLFTVVTFSWIAQVLHNFGFLPWPVAILALVLFGFVCQPQIYLAALPIRWVLRRFAGHDPHAPAGHSARRALFASFWIALFYSGLDWALPKLFVDTLGHALIGNPRLIQAADLGGPALLTFGVVFVSVAIWDLSSRLVRREEPGIWRAVLSSTPSLLIAMAMLAGWLHYGKTRLTLVEEKLAHPVRTLQAAVIQANIGDLEKLASERGFSNAAARVMRTFYDMTDQALALTPKPEVIIWPETSYPSNFGTPDTNLDFARDREMETFVQSRKVPIVFGGYDEDKTPNAQGAKLSYNALFYLTPESDLQTYRKNILLMFGEYIPGGDLIPAIKEIFPMVGFFGRGAGPTVTELLGVKTNPIICYEALFPQFIGDAVAKGSQLTLNVTNDSWFGPWSAPYHHLNLASFRSIESRVPQIRATNTGISALILPDGQITHPTKLFQPEILNVTIPIIEPIPTLIQKWGDWWAKFALTAVALATLLAFTLPRLRRAPR